MMRIQPLNLIHIRRLTLLRIPHVTLLGIQACVCACALGATTLWIAGVAAQPPRIDTSAIGPRVGQKVPGFSGTDQAGRTHTLESTLGANGAMLVFFRSADW